MPILDNPRQEQFCQLVAGGMSYTQAYEEAGYAPSQKNASRMMTFEVVKARVNELLNEQLEARQEVAVITKTWVLEQLRRNYERAMEIEPIERDGVIFGFQYNGSVANRALELIGKELGMFQDKPPAEIAQQNHFWFISDRELTEAEWNELYLEKTIEHKEAAE